MRIVIDIPDWRYKSICKGIEASKRCGVVGPDPVIHEAIYKGTPLPKEHGRLIDENELCEGRVSNDPVVIAVKCTPTIVEADAPKRVEGTPLEENDSGYNCENWIP